MWMSASQNNPKLFPRHLYQFACPRSIRQSGNAPHSCQHLLPSIKLFHFHQPNKGTIPSHAVVSICIFLVTEEVNFPHILTLYTAWFILRGLSSHSVIFNRSQKKGTQPQWKKGCLLAQYSVSLGRVVYDAAVMRVGVCIPKWNF